MSPPAFCQLPVLLRGCCEVLPSVLDERGCEALELGADEALELGADVVPDSYFCQPSPVFLYTLPFTSA